MRLPIPPLLALLPLALIGCVRPTEKTPTATPTPGPPQPPAIEYATVRPNEIGRIPIVMYHDIGAKKNGQPLPNNKLNRTVASFRGDLEFLYQKGFVPVNLTDMIDNKIAVPAGKSPVVITFDDARRTQFNLIESESAQQIDPECALGIMESFSKEHPDFPLHATFFILPQSSKKMDAFDQAGLGGQKLEYLLKNGMEVANHSTHHGSFRDLSATQIQKELADAESWARSQQPAARFASFALPYGSYPRNKKLWPLLLKGSSGGFSYEYRAALMAADRPTLPPGHKSYDPLRLRRVTPEDMRFGMRWWISQLKDRYISDGDPKWVSVPKALEAQLDRARLDAAGVQVNVYGEGGGGAKPIQGIGEGAKPISSGATTPSKPITSGTAAGR